MKLQAESRKRPKVTVIRVDVLALFVCVPLAAWRLLTALKTGYGLTDFCQMLFPRRTSGKFCAGSISTLTTSAGTLRRYV